MIIQYAALALVQRHMKLYHTPPTLQIFMCICVSVQFFKTHKMSKHISLFELGNVMKFRRQEWLIIIYTYFCNISSNYILFNNRIIIHIWIIWKTKFVLIFKHYIAYYNSIVVPCNWLYTVSQVYWAFSWSKRVIWLNISNF